MLAEAAEGRRPGVAQAYVPTERRGGADAGEGEVGTFRIGGAAVGSPTPHAGDRRRFRRPGRPSRRGRTVALVVALVVLVGGGVRGRAAPVEPGTRKAGSAASTGPSGTPSASPSASARPPPVRAGRPPPCRAPCRRAGSGKRSGRIQPLAPQRVDAAVDNGQIDYSPDGGEHFLRIAIDRAPDFDDPYLHQLDLEQQLKRLRDYKRVSLEANVYRDRKGSLWDFTWTALPKDSPFPGPRRAIEQAYWAVTEPSTCSTCPLRRPTGRPRVEQFTAVLRGWRPTSG